MSNPLLAPENTSSTQAVRSNGPAEVLKDFRDAGSDVAPLPAKVPPARFAPPARARTLPAALKDTDPRSVEEIPQLSERDSIFADHYLTVDSVSNSPHSPPSSGEGIEQDAAANGALPMRQHSHIPFLSLLQPKSRSSSTLVAMRGYSDEGSPVTHERGLVALKEILPPSLNSNSEKQDRTNRDLDRRPLLPFTTPVKTPIQQSSTPRVTSKPTCMSDTGGHELVRADLENKDERNGRPGPEEGSSGASTDDGGHSWEEKSNHVEKKIEATLANAEPGLNARSRKTSHYLGLFKENTASQEQKKREVRGRDRSRKDRGSQRRDSPKDGQFSSESQSCKRHSAVKEYPSRAGDAESLDSSRGQGLASAQSAAGPHQLTLAQDSPRGHIDEAPSPVSASLELLSSHPVERNRQDVRPKGKHSSVQGDQSMSIQDSTATHALPLRLLEEIRNHHNLTPGAGHGTSFSRSLPTTVSERSDTSHSRSSSLVKVERQEGYFDLDNDRSAQFNAGSHPNRDTEDDEYDSGKEQISSALYFPHKSRVLETSEGSGNERGASQNTLTHRRSFETALNSSDGWGGATDTPPNDGVEISLKSQHESQYLQGDLAAPKAEYSEVSEQIPALSAEDVLSSASDTEYESWDEIQPGTDNEPNMTDDADTTPTATPIAHTPIMATSRFPRSPKQPSAPLGAVELKPYDHQVGGHTTVFRFSRRAVCKQLSNRENEFYETIERQHPELLRFLPRYDLTFIPLVKAFKAERSAKILRSESESRCRTVNLFANEVLSNFI